MAPHHHKYHQYHVITLVGLVALMIIAIATFHKSNPVIETKTQPTKQGYDVTELESYAKKNSPPGGQLKEVRPGTFTIGEEKISVATYIMSGDAEHADISYEAVYAVFHDPEEMRIQHIGNMDSDGGVAEVVQDIFVNTFLSDSSKLAVVTMWDSSQAGGNSAMEEVGQIYEVAVFSYENSEFSPYQDGLTKPLLDCTCTSVETGEKRQSRFTNAQSAQTYIDELRKSDLRPI